jgi:hypothetical protein
MAWDSHYRAGLLKDLHKFSSDHCPLVLQINGISIPSSQLFRFDKEWIMNEEFNHLVKKWWLEITLSGDIGLSWHKKLKKLRQRIRGWYKNYMGEKHRKRKLALEQIHLLDKIMKHRVLTYEEVLQWQTHKSILDDYYLEEELYWKQRAKDQWLKEGDLNAAYFHRISTNRKKKYFINGNKW